MQLSFSFPFLSFSFLLFLLTSIFYIVLELGGNIPTTSIFGGFKIFSPETLNFVCFCYISQINNYLLNFKHISATIVVLLFINRILEIFPIILEQGLDKSVERKVNRINGNCQKEEEKLNEKINECLEKIRKRVREEKDKIQ